jgi:GNAT superfamily N-acetyltransferase
MQIHTATSDAQILACWDVVHALRPHLKPEGFVETIRDQQAEGYHLIYLEHEGRIVSAAGYRRMKMLFSGPIIYIDDLSTLPEARGRGHAGALLDHIFEIARREGLNGVQLDSGHHRHEAHRLYLNKGFKISSHHFASMF